MNHLNFKKEASTLYLITYNKATNTTQKKIATDLFNYLPPEVDKTLRGWSTSYERVIEGNEEIFKFGDKELIRTPIKWQWIEESARKDGLFCNVNFRYFVRLFKLAITKLPITSEVLSEPFQLLEGNPENKLIFFKGAVCRCTSFKDTACSLPNPEEEPLKLIKYQVRYGKTKFSPKKTLICFDCETCQIPNSDNHACYLLSAHVKLNLPVQLLTFNEETQEYEDMYPKQEFTISFTNYYFDKDIGAEFARWINKELEFISNINDFLLFGYNNNKFDNNFILEGFQKQGYSLIYNERNGKVTQGELQRKKAGNFYKVIINDLRKWIPDMSLQQACDDYNVEPKKLDYIDIVKFNECLIDHVPELCDEALFNKAIKKTTPARDLKKIKEIYSFKPNLLCYLDGTPMPGEKLVDSEGKPMYRIADLIQFYCEMDCRSTFALFNEIEKNVYQLIEDVETTLIYSSLPSRDFMDYMSASNLAGLILKLYLRNKDQYIMRCQNEALGKIIYSTYFGGRVNFGFLGEYKGVGNLLYMDVTSEYPLTMTGPMPDLRICEAIDIETEDGEKPKKRKKQGPNIHEHVNIGYTVDLKLIQETFNNLGQQIKQMLETKVWSWEPFSVLDWLIFFVCVDYQPPEQTDPEWLLVSQFAPVPLRIEDGDSIKYSNTAQFNKFITNAQAKNLLLSGFKITCVPSEYNIQFLKSDTIFAPLIDDFGKKKSQAKAEGNKTLAKLFKLIQNSFAGKMAQKPTHTISQYRSSETQAKTRQTHAEENWKSSMHYLAAIITSQANWVVFSTIYRLEMNHILNGIPREGRLGILYMDTDSIVYDSGIYPNQEFIINEETGHYQTNQFIVHWNRHYKKDIIKLVILGRKAYILYDKNGKPIDTKLKGIHGEQVSNFTSAESMATLLDRKPVSKLFPGLRKSHIMSEDVQGNQPREAYQKITNTLLKKTLKMDSYTETIMPANEQVIEANQSNLNSGKLIFCTALNKLQPSAIFNAVIEAPFNEEELAYMETL